MEIQGFSEILISDILLNQQMASSLSQEQRSKYQVADGDVLINVTAFLRVSPQAGSVSGVLSVVVADVKANTGVITFPSAPYGMNDVVYPISILATVHNPLLWYPIGYGDPNLYNLTLTFQGGKGEVDVSRKRVGFREIKLIRKEGTDDDPGITFYFQVNGIAVWAKGSNFVPFDAFHPRVTEANMTRVLESSIAGHSSTY